MHVDLSHEAPTPPGSTLTVHAELSTVDGRQLTFTVHAHDDAATVCRGTHRRAVMNIERFHARLRARTTASHHPNAHEAGPSSSITPVLGEHG
ncbi:hypothetical protein AB0K16_53745 [Nonomuraea jabiensis]